MTVLAGQVAVVTGAARGIGRALVTALAAAGATVVGVDVEPQADLAAGLHSLRADLANPDHLAGVLPEVVARHGRLDVLVNNAGLGRHAAVADIDPAELDQMWAVNTRATVLLTRDAFRLMDSGGQVVNVVSTAGLRGEPGESAYCATKAAVRGFTEAAASEGLLRGIRVHGIYPAGVDTGFWEGAVGDVAGFADVTGFLRPEDVATVVLEALTAPSHRLTQQAVVRATGDVDLDAVRDKLSRVARVAS